MFAVVAVAAAGAAIIIPDSVESTIIAAKLTDFVFCPMINTPNDAFLAALLVLNRAPFASEILATEFSRIKSNLKGQILRQMTWIHRYGLP